MSTKENDQWVESAMQNFEDAVEDGNLPLAKDIIADTLDAGFGTAARKMTQILRDTPVSKFTIISPIQRHDI